jgi:hypothetical protein
MLALVAPTLAQKPPSAQLSHEDAPVFALNFPFWHSVQLVLPSLAAYIPGEHCTQVAPDGSE